MSLVDPVEVLADTEATRLIRQLIRSYDPGLSCATHFLDLHVEELP